MNDAVKLLRDSRLYAIQKGASEAVTKLEVSEGGKVQFLVFLNPYERVLIMDVSDSDWQDVVAMRDYIANEIATNMDELV